jgi:hypothetical protein
MPPCKTRELAICHTDIRMSDAHYLVAHMRKNPSDESDKTALRAACQRVAKMLTTPSRMPTPKHIKR